MVLSHALVLCAGLGTRLRPLTDERPKPLIPVSGQPLAGYAMELLAAAGVRHLVANAYHLATQVEPALAPLAASLGQSLQVMVEPELRGTGGAILHALPHLGDTFVVFNGDVLASPDLARALAHHHATGAKITLVVRDDPRAARAGAIEVDPSGRVVRILGEGPCPAVPTRACLFTGIYLVSRTIADDLPREGCIVRHTLRRLLARHETVAAVVDPAPWYDLGTPAGYAEAQFALLQGAIPRLRGPAPEGRWIAPTAILHTGVQLVGPCAIDEGALLQGKGELSRVIVWPGARVEAPARSVIVSGRARVPLDERS